VKLVVWVALVIIICLTAPLASLAAQKNAPPTDTTPKATVAKKQPSAQEVADAKAKGLVWVNTATRVYHKQGPSYGTTRHGKFMTEEDAKKSGFRMASEPGRGKKP
jgi:hypothetical protein